MLDKIQITISAYNFEKLCKLHDEWKKQIPQMAEQDVNFVIDRLLELNERFVKTADDK